MSIETRDLLIEIGTEELPPKSLAGLAKEFQSRVSESLHNNDADYYYSPRRLAVICKDLPIQQPKENIERYGPAKNVAFGKDGKPTKAAEGFAKSCGVSIKDIGEKDGKLYFAATKKGKLTKEIIPDAITDALVKLPIPKRMRWGSGESEFIRPIHWIVIIFGDEVIPCEILGIKSGNKTYGHRFHHPAAIELHSTDEYLPKLKQAKVLLNEYNHQLQGEISLQARTLADTVNGDPLNSDTESDLVAEIAALVEWPVPLLGEFDKKFLTLPEELLISVLETQQRYFPVRDKKSVRLLPYFIAISNIDSNDKEQVVKGNERVIVPRLTDAMFFWESDKTRKLESHQTELDGIVFQKKLGSIGDKSKRVIELSKVIANKLDIDQEPVVRAAKLLKCDLVTSMVNEFPELQGITGKYLALHDGEPEEVAVAIEEHYRPRFAGDELPNTPIGQAVALADKMDTLAGIFGIGQQPTGTKDPFALRRAALGVVRILVEKKIPLTVMDLVVHAFKVQPDSCTNTSAELCSYILERAKSYFNEQGFTLLVLDSVLKPLGSATMLHLLPAAIAEASRFIDSDEGKSLAESNKRITNILKKSGFEVPFGLKPADLKQKPDESLFDSSTPAEKEFWEALKKFGEQSLALKNQEKFAEALRVLSNLAVPTTNFFDNVMVNVDNEKIRGNRIILLQFARSYMNQVADLSLMVL